LLTKNFLKWGYSLEGTKIINSNLSKYVETLHCNVSTKSMGWDFIRYHPKIMQHLKIIPIIDSLFICHCHGHHYRY